MMSPLRVHWASKCQKQHILHPFSMFQSQVQLNIECQKYECYQAFFLACGQRSRSLIVTTTKENITFQTDTSFPKILHHFKNCHYFLNSFHFDKISNAQKNYTNRQDMELLYILCPELLIVSIFSHSLPFILSAFCKLQISRPFLNSSREFPQSKHIFLQSNNTYQIRTFDIDVLY